MQSPGTLLDFRVMAAMDSRVAFFTADRMNFLRLADLLNIQVVTISIKKHPLDVWMPRIYQSSASLLVQRMVRHRQVRRGQLSPSLLYR